MVEVGDTVVVRDWLGDLCTIDVQRITQSSIHGDVIEGVEDGGKYRALPLNRVIPIAKLEKIGRGKWDLHLPDGKKKRYTTRTAANSYADKKGFLVRDY